MRGLLCNMPFCSNDAEWLDKQGDVWCDEHDTSPEPMKHIGGHTIAPPKVSQAEWDHVMEPLQGKARTFETGATRDTDEGKLDYEGFLSPLVLKRFAEYMHKNRVQSDGSLRASDNWQKGIPEEAYVKSLWRHFMDVWMAHDGWAIQGTYEEALCALLFNVSGLLHERLAGRLRDAG